MKRLDIKIANILNGSNQSSDFILADAKDGDMAFGVTAPGPALGSAADARNQPQTAWKTNADYLEQIREIIRQDIVDIVLLSTSNLERLAIEEGLFDDSDITPAARANDTTDIWNVRGGDYVADQFSYPFRTSLLEHMMHGRITHQPPSARQGADLGLYSITFTNNAERDALILNAYREFRIEAERYGFRHFLEVFNPQPHSGLSPEQIPWFVNDHIVRTLAGVPKAARPLFLKIPYNGPGPLEELAAYDTRLIVGVLGGSSGTARDAFQLVHDAKKYGAKAALFGRKINLAEHPLTMVALLRRVLDGDASPQEAVRIYHNELDRLGITPFRSLECDTALSENFCHA